MAPVDPPVPLGQRPGASVPYDPTKVIIVMNRLTHRVAVARWAGSRCGSRSVSVLRCG